MRELTINELDKVSGAGFIETTEKWAAFGGTAGTILGYAVTGTVQGATKWGFWGGGIGFAAGFGWGTGSVIYDSWFAR